MNSVSLDHDKPSNPLRQRSKNPVSVAFHDAHGDTNDSILLNPWVPYGEQRNVTLNNISVIFVTTQRCDGGLQKKVYQRSGS